MSQTFALQHGLELIVSDEDAERVRNSIGWYAKRSVRDKTWYAVRNVRFANGRRSTERFHNWLLGRPSSGLEWDHANHNGLDNQRANLRLATRNQ